MCAADIIIFIIFFYTCTINGIQSAEKKCIPFESIGKNYHTVPGWNEYVNDNHVVARDAFWLWNLYGDPTKANYTTV